MSITRAQRARLHDYAPTPEDIDAVVLALDMATDRLSNERAKRSRAEHRAVRAEAQSETRRQQTAYWQERAEGFEVAEEQLLLRNRNLLDAHREAEARIQAVRDVHRHIAIETRGIDVPEHRCLDCCLHWPCPTIRALDAP